MVGHARWVQCLITVPIILASLSRIHGLSELMNMLLLFYMRGKGWEYGLVYLFVVLKLLKRFFAFDFEFFNAFVL